MRSLITLPERQFLRLILPHLSPDKTVCYLALRKAGLPETAARIFNSKSEYLDVFMLRRLRSLERAGWVKLCDSVIKVLHDDP